MNACSSRQQRVLKRRYSWTQDLDQILEEGYQGNEKARHHAIDKIVELTNWPRQACWDRARHLNLTKKYHTNRGRLWTKQETDYLFWWACIKAPRLIAKHLGRSIPAVRNKLAKMGIESSRVTEGHTKTELAEYLGKSHHTIQKWIDRGWLKARYEGRNREDDILRINDEDFRDFFKKHTSEVSPMTLPLEGLRWLFSIVYDIPNTHEAVRGSRSNHEETCEVLSAEDGDDDI